MSRRPIVRSPDLLRLQNEGYDLAIRGGYLLVQDVPYVTSTLSIARGVLVVKLDLSGDVANRPGDHVAYWIGEHPCHADGSKLSAFFNPTGPQDLGHDLKVNHMFSAKAAYRDYHHKVTTYVGRIAGEADKVQPGVTARTFPAIAEDAEASVFKYVDTASSRAGIGAINGKIAGQRVAIIGLGGTGAYVLDLVAKTEVAEIHLFDGDVFSQHNAFRAPGAPSLDELAERPQKVARFADIYARMRGGIVVHDHFVDESSLDSLAGFDFVFICIDQGAAKRLVVGKLEAEGTPFVEVGMGVIANDDQLTGIVRVATSTRTTREQAARHISYADAEDLDNQYATNIQIAELNALNAALAVIRWKKLFGVYRDSRGDFHQGFSLASGEIVSEGER